MGTTVAERGTREKILEAAEASFGERGYHGTRLHLIAQRVGIQKASLFHYFPSKEHLYRAVLEEGFGQAEQTVKRVLAAEGDPLEKVRSLVGAYVEMVASHPQRTKILLRQSLGDTPSGYLTDDSERLLQLVASFVREAQQARLFVPIDPTGLILSVIGMVAFFFASVPVVAPSWLGDLSSAETVDRVKRYVVDVVERCLVPSRAPSEVAGSCAAAALPQAPRARALP
jgi:AcrR family transcriptional regulator